MTLLRSNRAQFLLNKLCGVRAMTHALADTHSAVQAVSESFPVISVTDICIGTTFNKMSDIPQC